MHHRRGDTMTRRLSRDEEPTLARSGALDQFPVVVRSRIVVTRNFGANRAVLFGQRIHSFEHLEASTLLTHLPACDLRSQIRMNVVTPGSDDAVNRPDHQAVASAPFQRVQVMGDLVDERFIPRYVPA